MGRPLSLIWFSRFNHTNKVFLFQYPNLHKLFYALKGVYTLPYSEIENLICSQLILDSLEEKSIISSEQITEFKDKIFLDMKENADSMAVVLVRDIINN